MGRHTARCATKQSQARISGLYAVLARGSTARRKRETASQCCDRLLRDLGIDKKMSKEELIQFEGLVIEILPDARYRVQLNAGYEVLGLHGRPPEIGARSLGVQTILSGRFP